MQFTLVCFAKIEFRVKNLYIAEAVHVCGSLQIVVCIIAASFHMVVGITMAYSATLIPQLENPNEQFHATQQQTSWIGKIARIYVACVKCRAKIAKTQNALFREKNALLVAADCKSR